MGPVTLHTLTVRETPILSSCRQSSWISPLFSALQYRMFWEFTANVRKTRHRLIETLTVELFQCVQDWRNQFQKCIFEAANYSFKVGTAVFVCGRSCDNCIAPHADVFATLIAWASRLRDFLVEASIIGRISFNVSSVSTVDFNLASCLVASLLFFGLLTTLYILCLLGSGCEIFCPFFKQSHVCKTITHKTTDVQQCAWLEGFHYITELVRNTLTAANSMIDGARLLLPTAKFTPPFDTVPEIFDGRVIRWHLWPPYSPDLTPFWLLFVGTFER